MENQVKIHFLGAAGTVTGSKFLLETSELNILIDCGLFQGIKSLRELNWKDFPFDPKKIDLILLTHGHLDHTGYLPRLVKQGYKNPILGTPPSLGIAEVILNDSAKIQEEDAERANKEEYSKHEPALPLYTTKDAERAIGLFQSINLDEWYQISENIKYSYQANGHILGSAFIELDIFNKRFVFSGDIGRKKDLLLEPPKKPEKADYLFLESTYGDRLHPEDDSDEIFTEAIKDTIRNNGNLIIPSFAVERLQGIMYRLYLLMKSNRIPEITIYIDSPMGNKVLGLFERFSKWHKVDAAEFRKMLSYFNIITSYRDTWKTIDEKRTKVVIAGSGMVTGGRVLTYLRYLIDKPETTVLLAGYQAEGTRGRQLENGAAEIKIFGKYCPVKAKVLKIDSLSAHADQQELLDWLSEIKNVPEKVFLIHGEPTALDSLRVKIKDFYNVEVNVPQLHDIVSLKL
ncbi:MBL fold metallo-hydrolase RNA specificity domain-containing protein [Salegentibacter mishustinae]|uniref:MBL fold metallo-hydrolase n=1 Tax=Salegentibacter mishustinae TaxID=270918 RepID=A0A0Q9ZHQ5_9FLAO|nr:MBL fold metallo-hydrolase [Salegentibacter mishustinae]KRG29210.1 MBL fold metallo-hydrolase [Salegentibacter mishustinae]PNW21740.1 MBL fold metallo-hydrolase [Salegentibacter mishustinae]PZX65080.1 metallo-beta-lactamase family protein [Salegentibacter mishustinae]GGW87442.1 MBL fold hydrolase [Salegentibacter mishustinae]